MTASHFSHTHSHLREAAQQTTSRLSWSLFLTLAFVLIEATAGYFANSLALLTDAAHNLTDVIALGLSWFAIRLTAQPANARKTYEYHRAGILVALFVVSLDSALRWRRRHWLHLLMITGSPRGPLAGCG